jgi:hypothetical protein
MFKTVQLGHGSVTYYRFIMDCSYCRERATVRIPSVPGDVCLTHALEYWSELFAHVKANADPGEKPEAPCTCLSCKRLSASNARSSAVGAGIPSPHSAEIVQARRAS